jgi:RimJ/RimL family protein N-acetyltransferase
MPVRPLAEKDIPQIASLYWTVLRERKGPPPPAVQSFLHELYFTNPWIDSNIPSLVYDDKGKIAGFLGVVPRKMSLRGEPVRIAYGGNFVVHPEFRNTLAGLHLLRTYMAGSQDLSQTDSANDVSRALLERLGFSTILPLSVHWVRLLRPAHSAIRAVTSLSESALVSSLAFLSAPFLSMADTLATRLSSSPFRQREPELKATELDVETLLDCLNQFRNGYALWPEYDAQSLTWLLSFMERMKGHGKTLRRLALRDNGGQVVGWYVYYLTPGGFAEVAQIGGARRSLKAVLDHLFYDAWRHDAIALHGTLDSRLMAEFSEKNCFFTCRGGWTVAYARKPSFLELLNTGEAFLSRLDGEWCLDFGA